MFENSVSLGDSAEYFYDDSGRLSRVVNGTSGIIYKYDELGNVVSATTATTEDASPVITSINPSVLFVGTTLIVTITGQNLLTTESVTSNNGLVLITNVTATDTQITAEMYALSAGSDTITVTTRNGTPNTAEINVTLSSSNLTLSPGQVALAPSSSGTVTATISPPLSSALTINLVSNAPSIASAPQTVTIPSSGSASFTVDALQNGVDIISAGDANFVVFVESPFTGDVAGLSASNVSVSIAAPNSESPTVARPVSLLISNGESTTVTKLVSVRIDASGPSTNTSKLVSVGRMPGSSITSPLDGAILTSTSCNITGTALYHLGLGLLNVQLSLDDSDWLTASGTSSWSYLWTVPSSGPHTIKSRATDNAGNVQSPPTVVNVTAKSSLSTDRAGVNLNSNLALPAPMTKVKVTSQPWGVSGSATSTKPWLQVSPASGSTPSSLKISADTSSLAAGNYTSVVAFSSAYASHTSISVPVSLTVVPASTLTPENQHYSWDASLTGGNCNVCHIARSTFLPSDFNRQNSKEFCYSCHNRASVAHEQSDYAKAHTIFASATAGGGIWPTYGSITAAQNNNQPFARLKDGSKIVCATCHNSMGKHEDYGRAWELTSTTDRYIYYLSYGGWANYGQLSPVVYRTTSVMSAPTYSKSRKDYVVKPSEYTFDEVAGSVTFVTQQSTSAYIYVTLDYPYLRASSQDNRLCSDCHTQLTHQENNCLICHQAHNAANIAGIRSKVRTSDQSEKSVSFLRYTGVNSFADGNTTYDGICEVCHSATKYYKRDGTGFVNHSGGNNYNKKNCEVCHQHKKGFSKYTSVSGGDMFIPDGGDMFIPDGLDNFSM